jgi:hypothetical protein
VFVSSAGHALGTGVNFSTLGRPEKPENYERMEVYHQVKSANVLTAIELSKRSKGRINAYSLHPGGVYLLYLPVGGFSQLTPPNCRV